MNRKIPQTETEWLYSQLEFIASNRATGLLQDTIKEYELVVQSYHFNQQEAIEFLKEKYQKYQGERPPVERFNFKQAPKNTKKPINLQAMLRYSSDGVMA